MKGWQKEGWGWEEGGEQNCVLFVQPLLMGMRMPLMSVCLSVSFCVYDYVCKTKRERECVCE